jgi:hypothetical protein
MMKAARALTAGAAAATVLGGRNRVVAAGAGAACVAASVLTRFGIFQAGIASAEDPKYTVVPQRDRVAKRRPEAHHTRG